MLILLIVLIVILMSLGIISLRRDEQLQLVCTTASYTWSWTKGECILSALSIIMYCANTAS